MTDDIVDDVYLRKLELAWKCVMEQCFDIARNSSMEEGEGISIFKFLKKTEGCNCHYFYSKAHGTTWDTILSSASEYKNIAKKYDHNSMVMICVQVPVSETLCEDETRGNIKLFSIDTKKEILLEDSDTSSVPSSTSQSHTPTGSSSSSKHGLRKRK
jgi:hypothetical protein